MTSFSATSAPPEATPAPAKSPTKLTQAAAQAMAQPENQAAASADANQPTPHPVGSSPPPQASLAPAGEVIGDYALGATIGKGTFGKVKLGRHLATGEKVAVKILEKKRIVELADVERVAREIKILKRNRHANVIQLFEVIDAPERILLIMEFVDRGEMFEHIVAHHRIREPEAVVLFQQIVDGLEYLHANEVTHRDLKPENLLLQSCGSMPTGLLVKIVDFGLSNTHDNGRLLRTACGSPCYAAPEMIQGKLYSGPLADVWSLGVVLFAMVCGYLPFEDSNTNLLYKKILSADYKLPPFLSHAVQDLIRRIFETDPEKRLTTAMIRQHPWFSSSRVVHRSLVASSDDARVRSHILKQLAASGMEPDAVQDALAHKAHNRLTAAYYLLYNKLVRLMKDQAAPPAVVAASTTPLQAPSPPQSQSPPLHLPPSSAKSDGTPRRPEATTSEDRVPSMGIRTTKEAVPIKAPSSSAAAIAPTTPLSAAAETLSAQRRRTSDTSGAPPSLIARTPSSVVASPRGHSMNMSRTSAVRRPSSVRGGRNLVLLTSGALVPAGSSATTAFAAQPQRPPMPAAITSKAMARLPSQGGSGARLVALSPLFPQPAHTRPTEISSRRRQTTTTISDAPMTACYMAPTATTTAVVLTASAGNRRHVTTSTTTTTSTTPAVVLSPPLPAASACGKDDDVRVPTPPSEPQRRIPPQRPHPPPP